MSGWTKAHQTIKDELVGKTGVRVLVVEGVDDKAFLTNLLDKKTGGWANQWAVGVAGGKQNVLKILEKEADWLGVVDCDEWSDGAAAQSTLTHPNLYILPRFCMENYFIEPDEIWAALPVEQQNRIGSNEAAFKTNLGANLDSWLRHGALWHAVNPLWDGLRAIGFKDKLLELQTAQNDSEIRTTLEAWHDHLEPNGIFSTFQLNLNAARAAGAEAKYRKWIHGKRFFNEVIVRILSRSLEQKAADVWLTNLRRTMPLPLDLGPLWRRMNI